MEFCLQAAARAQKPCARDYHASGAISRPAGLSRDSKPPRQVPQAASPHAGAHSLSSSRGESRREEAVFSAAPSIYRRPLATRHPPYSPSPPWPPTNHLANGSCHCNTSLQGLELAQFLPGAFASELLRAIDRFAVELAILTQRFDVGAPGKRFGGREATSFVQDRFNARRGLRFTHIDSVG